MTQDTDHLGRPIVVVTGMGVLTSLGQGQADNWKALTGGVSGIRRISRFPIDGLRTTIAGTVDFVPVPEPSAPALSQRLAELVIEEARGRGRHRPRRRFSRAAVPGAAAGGNGMDAAPRARRRVRRERGGDLRRSAPRRRAAARSSRTTAASCSARWARTWRTGSAPRARRSRPRPPAPPAARPSSSASRRSAAARPTPRWWSAPMPRSIPKA